MSKKLWGGRFQGTTDALVEKLGESVSFDARLAPWDIRGSIAHARMLGDCGIIPKADARKIMAGLKQIDEEIERGDFTFSESLEDVHMNIESALTERIGDAGKRLHTGRSRNDQIATDVRMWARDQVDTIIVQLAELQLALIALAENNMSVILPGTTHLQHAQPVLLAHHLHAYVEMFARDAARFGQLHARINVMPLGSAALAGTPYPIDRKQVAEELGFDAISTNSMDAVSDRDYLIEFCANASICMMHLSRMCEEFVLWSSPGYAYITISDRYTTGSSIMPQKKNPDVAELVRGKTGRVYGDLTALLTLMKGLPMTYNRDLQEDKEPAFDSADTLQLCLAVTTGMLGETEIHSDRMLASTREGFLEATDLADFLVERGVAFREAHDIVGRLVAQCEKEGLRFADLSPEAFARFHPALAGDLSALLDPVKSMSRRDQPGGTAPKRVRAALRKSRKHVEKLLNR